MSISDSEGDGEAKKNKKEENEGGGFQDILGVIASPKFGTALKATEKLKELIHTQKNSHIQHREKTSGFEFLNVRSNLQQAKGAKKTSFLDTLKKDLEKLETRQSPPEIIELARNVYKYVEEDAEEYAEQTFAIVFQDSRGHANALFYSFSKRSDGKYNFKKLLFEGSFQLAADLVILRESKKGFFRSSSKDVIKYLPRRGVTQQDISDLLDVIVPQIAVVMASVLPEFVEDSGNTGNEARIQRKDKQPLGNEKNEL